MKANANLAPHNKPLKQSLSLSPVAAIALLSKVFIEGHLPLVLLPSRLRATPSSLSQLLHGWLDSLLYSVVHRMPHACSQMRYSEVSS